MMCDRIFSYDKATFRKDHGFKEIAIKGLRDIEDTNHVNCVKVLQDNSYKSVDEAKKNYIEETDITILKLEIEDYKDKLKESNTLLADYKKKKYDKLEKKDLDFLSKQKEEASEKYDSLNKQFIKDTSKCNNNSKAYKALFEKSNSFDNKTSEYNEIEALYNVASGKVSGNKKINFEVYYQVHYLFYSCIVLGN